jgi:hypothetical protein
MFIHMISIHYCAVLYYITGVFGDLGLMGVGRFISTPLGVYEAAGLENVGPGKVVAFPSVSSSQFISNPHTPTITSRVTRVKP